MLIILLPVLLALERRVDFLVVEFLLLHLVKRLLGLQVAQLLLSHWLHVQIGKVGVLGRVSVLELESLPKDRKLPCHMIIQPIRSQH